MITGIDHIVIMVADLEQAERQWSELGFTVITGGKHPRGTHNALICFEDGSYLELIAFWEPDYEAHRWHRFHNSGAGLIDHALGSDDLAMEIIEARSRGIEYVGPSPGARSRPDGVELAWRTAAAAGGTRHDLPFLIDDVTDRDLRVPSGDARVHANGVLGIDTLQIVVMDLMSSGTQYAGLLDVEIPVISPSTALGQASRTVTLQAGEHPIELHQPEGSGPASERLATFGDGPYAVRFHGTNPINVNPAELDGARIGCRVR